MSELYDAIHAMVRRIPAGRVATYGQIARLIDRPRHARQVGYALNALPEDNDVPWHRVVNTKGEISPRAFGDCGHLQRQLLQEEGVLFEAERIPLKTFQWNSD